MDHDLLIKAYEAAQKGQSYAFATIVESTIKGTPRKAGAKMIVLQDGTLFGSIGGGRNEKATQKECLKAIQSGKSALVTYDYFGGEGNLFAGDKSRYLLSLLWDRGDLLSAGLDILLCLYPLWEKC